MLMFLKCLIGYRLISHSGIFHSNEDVINAVDFDQTPLYACTAVGLIWIIIMHIKYIVQ